MLPASDQTARQGLLRQSYQALQDGRADEAARLALPYADGAGNARDLEARLLAGLALGCLPGQAAEAAHHLVAVADARPEALHPCMDLVSLLQKRFRMREAMPVFQACLALAPEEWRLRLGYGQLLTELGRFDEAVAEVRHSLALQPGAVPALNQMGILLIALGQTDEAIDQFRQVVAIEPQNHAAWANIGCTLVAEGEFEEALSAYRRSIHIKPDAPQVRLNHSIGLLKAGRMVQGWAEHEWRFRLPGHTELPLDRMLPTLSPETRLDGRSVLLTHEEGAGDTLMHLRYVPPLARLGARITVWVPPNLARLAARVEGVAEVLDTEQIRLQADWHCPFISLPRAFSATAMPWGQAVPYLSANPDLLREAARQLPPARGALRVGLVWGGAPRSENLSAAAIDRRRSIGLAALAPLSALRGIKLVSLQHGPYAAELSDPPDGLAIADPMGFVQDMDDTAALMQGLDLVVSVDTSMVHLAGGLGIPTILLDRYDNCWRWFHGREDSPWYPNLRILRQASRGDWDGVVARLVPMLQAMADSRR